MKGGRGQLLLRFESQAGGRRSSEVKQQCLQARPVVIPPPPPPHPHQNRPVPGLLQQPGAVHAPLLTATSNHLPNSRDWTMVSVSIRLRRMPTTNHHRNGGGTGRQREMGVSRVRGGGGGGGGSGTREAAGHYSSAARYLALQWCCHRGTGHTERSTAQLPHSTRPASLQCCIPHCYHETTLPLAEPPSCVPTQRLRHHQQSGGVR